MRIGGKVAVVTGASSGLGRAIALMLAKHGADVALVARREPRLRELSEEITALGRRALVVPADVGDPGQIEEAYRRITSELGSPDILVNAAGVAVWKPYSEITLDEHRAMMDVNYWGAFHWIRCCLPDMRDRGTGHIVNISAGTGKIGLPVTSGFSASKFALTGLSEALHRELLRTRVGISCVHPGSMRTDFWDEQNIPRSGLPPLVRYSPKLSPQAVARHVGLCIWFRIPVRTLPVFVALLTRVNAVSIRLGDLMLWKWFIPVLSVSLLLLFIF